MQLLFLLVLCLLGGGTATPEEELQILSQFRASLTAATSRTFESWDAGSSACGFAGVRCDSTGSVSEIDLTDAGVSGEISFASLCRLPSLSSLSLGSNSLSGSVSADLRNCTALRRLDLAANNLAGPFPDLAPLSELRVLNLSGNTLTGAFPWGSLARLTGLQVLNLGDNSFDPSPFPKEVVSLTKLNWVFLSSCNIHGDIPPSIGNLTELVDLELADNFLTGGIPPEIARLSKLWMLELYNNSLTGRIPAGFGNLSRLAYFDASMNQLEGDLAELRSLTNLVSLQLFTNDLSGEVPPEFGEFRYLTNLSLYTNRLNGTLPPTLGSRANFDFIDVSTNFFTGGIPPDMCKRGTMTRLLILENNFTGEIPANYGSCLSLVRFRVSKNSLSGVVPAGLWGLPNLNIIDLAVNQFEGGIGAGIGKAKSLYQLYLNKNRFSGLLPPEIGGVTSIVNIDVSYNRFYGEIPASIGELKQLLSLNFESNAFSGTIPNAIGSCVRLSSVGLAANNLSGPIPASLGHLTSLNSLDLSNNQLSGEIPVSLAALKLSALDLSNNQLTGAVPAALAIAAYNRSFAGNSGLCAEGGGANSVRSLRQCPATTKGSSDELRVVLTCFLAGAAVILACFGLYIALRKRLADGRGGHHAVVKDPSWDLKSFRILTFDEQEIVDAIKPDNLIGKGGSGEVYRVELASGEVVAVKHIWNDPVGGTKERSTTAMLGARGRRRPARREFEAEVATLSAVRHVNVVKLYCSITSEESCLLVYEHLPNGSLWDRLHGPSGGKASELGWDERYEIAVGAARGLEYLHHGWDRPILHRDVKSSNILLDQCFKPRIADFGLAKVLQSTASGAGGGKEGSSAHVIAGTYGYIAPEYAYTWKVNEKGDVYSFGVVLMELMTGRRPIDPEYGENKDIVHWASRRMGNRESVMAMVDLRIPEWAREEAVKVLRIAVLCTARLPATRPSMRAVVQMLEEAGRCRAFSGAVGGGKVEKVEKAESEAAVGD
ncbi:Leucine rich repeat N-terminal domain [Musa troglodytarum]|uniref:non-specific serine/threonine protein kinase n=1 Tax=Musa troglodytarum TaxID=320322 RepID=A0A9E7IBX3_9LILI|nr:Leucine rich repeat N-terminal domain [Musa troglodytarum]